MKRLLIKKSNINDEDLTKLRGQYSIFEENLEQIVIEVRDEEADAVASLTGALHAMYE